MGFSVFLRVVVEYRGRDSGFRVYRCMASTLDFG